MHAPRERRARLRLGVSVAALAVLVAGCGSGPSSSQAIQDGAVPTSSSSEQVRRDCAAFTADLAAEDSNEVYDPATEELHVHIGDRVYVLSESAEECRSNPAAAERLRQNRVAQQENGSHSG